MEIASLISIAQISMVGGAAGIWPSGLGVAGSRHARSTAVRQKPSPRELRSLMQFGIAMLAWDIGLQAAATTTPRTTIYVFTMCQFIALFLTQVSFVQVKSKNVNIDMIHFTQITHPSPTAIIWAMENHT